MPYEDALRASLRCLYNEALKFRVNIDIIVKLAKSLKLDTFVDSEEIPGVTRLSIAGSLLLLEIDFSDENTVSKVSLSLGNHLLETLQDSELMDRIAQNIISVNDGPVKQGKTVTLSLLPDLRTSFLKTSLLRPSDGEKSSENGHQYGSVAESILLSSLSGPTLGSFPRNLKYLADIDRVSPPEADLIVYMDNLATYLAAIHFKETELNPENWQVAEGFTSSFGKVCLNDEKTQRVGVFLTFWHDCRLLSHKYAQTGISESGKSYLAILALEESTHPAIDYVAEAQLQPWPLQDAGGNVIPHFFRAESSLSHLHEQQSVIANASWKLVLRFTETVFLPKSLLEYLGITDYECAKELDIDRFWQTASEQGELRYRAKEKHIILVFEEDASFTGLLSISISNLHVLSDLMPAVRNLLVLTKLMASVALANCENLPNFEAESDKESKDRIRNSLQIPNDVADEEILGLNSISGDYMGENMIDRDLKLDEYTKSEGESDPMVTDDFDDSTNPPTSAVPLLVVVFQEICYGTKFTDFGLSISDTELDVDAQMVIRNGVLSREGDDIDMEASATDKFVHALAISEDILLSLEALSS
ncbi:Mediator of RNA polymerase II transcription subunit 1 [Metschnikowia aff. pulcherrima]|uniref:Mediator of RNA polymerase II transcription subunit 1 n=1 Tax=Metschnikowia aff. pulcherrima TaxID=2163413 RepID=A0A4P6XR52_9ASCO|nr:Mediator of RNA polymerase II transcription subunit 1 [Metschnikowia aff. pulcherrima]